MIMDSLGLIAPAISLALGLFFFIYAARYYIFVGLVLGGGDGNVNRGRNGSSNGNGYHNGNGSNNVNGGRNSHYRFGFLSHFTRRNNGSYNGNGHFNGNHNGKGINSRYSSILSRFAASNGKNGVQNGNNNHNGDFLSRFATNGNGSSGKNGGNHAQNNGTYPFVSIHLPFYNEKNVALRILDACLNLDYPNFEIVVVDDSTDETFNAIRKWARYPKPVNIKIIHRVKRTGFKGGALNVALDHADPRAEYVVIFDADFIPPPDTIRQFLAYFTNGNGNRNGNNHNGNHDKTNGVTDREALVKAVEDYYRRREIAVVQGYQQHVLNGGENWITRGVRAEYSGNYMVERSCQEILGAMKMISGSVYMIRADVLRRHRWSASLTEDWELTIRLYLDGYKILYTPLIAAPAEIPNTLGRLVKQRMRWAEGHTYNVKENFGRILRSRRLSIREKLEFLYYAPYYLQSLLFIVGTAFWFVSEALHTYIPMWTATFGWALVLSNLASIPLMNLSGLFLEKSTQRDWRGIFSCVALSYILAPYMALASLKGLFEREEGTWIRTFKTGLITEKIIPLGIRKLGRWFRPLRKKPAEKKAGMEKKRTKWFSMLPSLLLLIMSTTILSVSFLGTTVPPVKAQTLVDNTWYLTDTTAGLRKYTMNDGFPSTSAEAPVSLASAKVYVWYSNWPYTPAQDMTNSNWQLILRVSANTFSTSPKNLIVQVGYSASSGGTFTDLSSGGTTVDIVGWTNGNSYTVVINVSGTLPNNNYVAVQLTMPTQGGSSLDIYVNQYTTNSRLWWSGNLVPENALLLLLVAPIIPIVFSKTKRKK